MKNILEPREVERPFIGRWMRSSLQLIVRSPVQFGLVVVLLLVIGGLLLTRVLRGMSQLQDCALSGRSNCS